MLTFRRKAPVVRISSNPIEKRPCASSTDGGRPADFRNGTLRAGDRRTSGDASTGRSAGDQFSVQDQAIHPQPLGLYARRLRSRDTARRRAGSSVPGARDRDAREGREALGEGCVAAPAHSHLPVDDHAGDPGNVPPGDRRQLSLASDADGASQTTRSAGAPTAIVPVPAARRNARLLFPVARAITTSGGRSPSDASSHTLFMTPMGMTPVPVGVSLATHTRASAPA